MARADGTVTVETLTAAAIERTIPALARLRIAVFRHWPYLYDGDMAYEARYLARFAKAEDAVLIVARDGERIVGASTGAPLAHEDAAFRDPLARAGYDVATTFYLAESVLDPHYRGRGLGHRFFDAREAHARALGASHAAFCAVIRSDDHPARPDDPRDLHPFWRARGYAPVEGAIARFDWRDVGAGEETTKSLQFWSRSL